MFDNLIYQEKNKLENFYSISDDNIFDEDDDDRKDEDLIALEELDEIEDTRVMQDDLFEGIDISDYVRMYLEEIGQYQLLNIEREKRLAKEKQQAQNILKKKDFDKKLNISKEDAIKLPIDPARAVFLTNEEMIIVKTGELDQKILIESNLRLVVSIAKRYIGQGLSLLDLIQEGNLGLARAVEKFDYKMGFKLSTYAVWWIRQAITRAIDEQSKTIRVPAHIAEVIKQINKKRERLTLILGCKPTIKQLAKEMKMTEEKVEEVEEVIQITKDPISLDCPVGDEDDSILAEYVSFPYTLVPNCDYTVYNDFFEETMCEIFTQSRKNEVLRMAVSFLNKREYEIISLRYGLDDDIYRSLDDVGKIKGISKERVRQIESKALGKVAKILKRNDLFKDEEIIHKNKNTGESDNKSDNKRNNINKLFMDFNNFVESLCTCLNCKNNIEILAFKKSKWASIHYCNKTIIDVYYRKKNVEAVINNDIRIIEEVKQYIINNNLNWDINNKIRIKNKLNLSTNKENYLTLICALTNKIIEIIDKINI